jgi:hypothetical protein
MIDGGYGNLKDAIDSLFNSYEMICIVEGITESLKKEEIADCIIKGYEHHMREHSLKYLRGELETNKYTSRCNLHYIGEIPFLWFEIQSGVNGEIEFYIVKQPEENNNE